MVVDSNPVAVAETSDITSVSRKEFLNIQANIELGFTLKCVRDMIIKYSQKVPSYIKGRVFHTNLKGTLTTYAGP